MAFGFNNVSQAGAYLDQAIATLGMTNNELVIAIEEGTDPGAWATLKGVIVTAIGTLSSARTTAAGATNNFYAEDIKTLGA